MSGDDIRAALALIGAGEPTKAANLLRDSLEQLGDLADFDIEQPPTWEGARSRIWDEWRECIFNGGGGFPEGGVRALYEDAAAVAAELDRRVAARQEAAKELADLRLLLVGHQGTPAHVMRDLAGMGIKADERAERAEAEVERLQKLVWGAVHNAGRAGHRRPRWSAVTDALGVGSTTAAALCVAHDSDPDEMVGHEEEA